MRRLRLLSQSAYRLSSRFKLLAFFLALTLGLGIGCTGFSEDELNKLKEENVALAAELEAEKREAQILNRALSSVYKERDRLVDLLNSSPQLTNEQSTEESEAQNETQQQAQRKVYQVQSGDTLSVIAQRNNTTVSVLLRLNPFLADRQNYMVWERDQIVLP